MSEPSSDSRCPKCGRIGLHDVTCPTPLTASIQPLPEAPREGPYKVWAEGLDIRFEGPGLGNSTSVLNSVEDMGRVWERRLNIAYAQGQSASAKEVAELKAKNAELDEDQSVLVGEIGKLKAEVSRLRGALSSWTSDHTSKCRCAGCAYWISQAEALNPPNEGEIK